MLLDQSFLDELTAQAQSNPRLRQAYDLRTTSEDQSQRILNALEPGTQVPVHRHATSAETLVVVRGRLLQKLYNEKGELIETYEMVSGGASSVMQIPTGQFHSLECLESGTVIFEAKDGAYAPLAKEDVISSMD